MKPTRLNLAIAATIAIGLATACADDSSSAPTLPPASTRSGVTYATDIKPIFMANCMPCHSSTGPKKPKAGLALDSLAAALKGGRDGKVLKPGDSAHSDLVLSVAHVGNDPDSFMPKGKNARMLSPEKVGLIRAWIDQGAK